LAITGLQIEISKADPLNDLSAMLNRIINAQRFTVDQYELIIIVTFDGTSIRVQALISRVHPTKIDHLVLKKLQIFTIFFKYFPNPTFLVLKLLPDY
jgi:hypothetical protein